ncbi:hypothetical protein C1646_662393 [Rhizophagus diaphanus]|nr:hypothetical protein C1646_662393 [Rhizophagus diaphanus] [Rhizophagus sp. MUCL 43196]
MNSERYQTFSSFSKKKNISLSKIHFITLRNYTSSIKLFCYIVGTKIETAFEITSRSDTSIAKLKDLIYEKKKRVFENESDASDLILWKVDISAKNIDKLRTLEQPLDTNVKNIEKLGEKLIPLYIIGEIFEQSSKNICIIVQLPAIFMDMVLKGAKGATNANISRPVDKMPFMERDIDKAIARITRNIESHLTNSQSSADYDILVSGGAPGIGKTRYGDELFKHLENNQYWVPSEWKNNHIESLYIDFGNDCKLNSYDDELTPTLIIGLRIAFVFYIKGKYQMKFETFRRLIGKYCVIFTISDVFESIYNHLGLKSDNKHLFVFLHIDEFQLIDEWESNAVMKRKMVEKELFKNMITNLALYMFGPSHIFVQPFLSGTAPHVVNSVKESSNISFGFVNCPQLSLRAMLKIANHYAQKFDAEKFDCGEYKWMLCQPFLQLLEDTGGLPRALQYVFYECFRIEGDGKKFFKEIDRQNFDNIFHKVKAHLQERYNIYKFIQKNEKLALELLYHSIDGIPVSVEECLDESKPEYTIENLESYEHIILNPCNADPSKFTINMPFFFICIYNDSLNIVNKELEKVFQVQNDMYWQSWETFVANYDAFRTNLLIKRGKESARLSELYRGAYGTPPTLNIKVKLKELSVCYAGQQFPCKELTDKESNSIDWAKGGNVIINGASAEWGDAFVVRKKVQNNKKNNKKYILIHHQCKYYLSGAYYTAKDLNNEHHILGSASATKKLWNILSKCQHITIAFMIQPCGDPISTPDCLVIMKSNFKKYFGPIFASRAMFSMTKDINPNFSDISWMINEISGIGKVTASEIIKTQPHLSEDYFYKKFSRTKRSIVNYEDNKPGKKIKLNFHPFNVEK